MNVTCPTCNGSGERYHAPLHGMYGQYAPGEWEPCPTCKGACVVELGICDLCNAEAVPVRSVVCARPGDEPVTLVLCAECALAEERARAWPAPSPRRRGSSRMYRLEVDA